MRISFLFFPLALIALSIITAAGVVIKNFPTLSVLDVENIPEVKEEKKKEALLRKRVEKLAEESAKIRAIRFAPFLARMQSFERRLIASIGQLERRIRRASAAAERSLSKSPRANVLAGVRTLLSEADTAFADEDFESAEKKYISAIRLDEKNKDAYRGLGDVYLRQGHLAEAKETFAFVSSLDPRDDGALVKLSEIAQRGGDTHAAIDSLQRAILLNDNLANRFASLAGLFSTIGEYQAALEAASQAVDLDPRNLSYLDSRAELAILVGDATLAKETVQAMRMIDPTHHALPPLQDKIQHMPP